MSYKNELKLLILFLVLSYSSLANTDSIDLYLNNDNEQMNQQFNLLLVMLTAVAIALLVAIGYFIYRRVKKSKSIGIQKEAISKEELERISKIKGRCKVLDEWVIVGVFDELNKFGKRKDNYTDSLTEITFEGYENSESPIETQLDLICYFYNNQKAILEKICEGIKKEYPKLMELYNVESYNADYGFPEIKSNEDIQNIIEIQCIGITQEDDGSALLTFWGNCSWDEEHGFGIVMNKQEVIRIGDVDEAIVW